MYDALQYFGWLSLSPAEKWDIAFKFLGLSGTAFAAWWTITGWFLTKKIELERSLLESLAANNAYLFRMGDSEPEPEKTRIKRLAVEKVEENSVVAEQIENGQLSLKKLRKLNNYHLSRRIYLDTHLRLTEKEKENVRIG